MLSLRKIVAILMMLLLIVAFTPNSVSADDSQILEDEKVEKTFEQNRDDIEEDGNSKVNSKAQDTTNDNTSIVAEPKEIESLKVQDSNKLSGPKSILSKSASEDTNEDVKEIKSIEELDDIRNEPDGNYILMVDLDLSQATSEGGICYNNGQGWNPIGSAEPFFTGCFDGNGHVISGIYSKGTMGSNGLFGINKGAISNLKIEDSTFEGDSDMIGPIASANYGLIDNCEVASVINSNVKAGQKKVGGVTGLNLNVVSYCSFSGNISFSNTSDQLSAAGGIAGYNEGTIKNSENTGELSINTDVGDSYAGGIVGISTVGELNDNTNNGSVDATSNNAIANAGGIVGLSIDSANRNVNNGDINANASGGKAYSGGIIGFNRGPVSDCTNIGAVVANSKYSDTESYSGGIVGYGGSGEKEGTIRNCSNKGEVLSKGSATILAGGIAGELSNTPIMYSYNAGNVECSVRMEDYTRIVTCGGLAGMMDAAVVTKSFNQGKVTGNDYSDAGGITGRQKGESAISECYNTGNINGTDKAGGICAFNSAYIVDCYNAGTISGEQDVGGIVGSSHIGAHLGSVYNVGKIKGYNNCGIVSYQSTYGSSLAENTIFTINYSRPAARIYDHTAGKYVTLDNACTYGEMIKSSTYYKYDFSNVWSMGSGKYRFPILIGVLHPEKQNSIDLCKSGHTWNKGTITSKATCIKSGVKKFSCLACGKTKNETIPSLGHKWIHYKNAAGYLKDGSEYDQCKTCKVKKNVKVLSGYSTYYVKSLKVKKAKCAFTVKWKKQSKKNLKKFDGYQIRYSTASNMSGAKFATAGKKTKSKKIKGLTKKTKYFVQVRTFTKSGGKTFYSKWSAKKSVKTK